MTKDKMLSIKTQHNLINYFGSQSAIATALDVSPQFVSKWFNGLRDIPILQAMKIEKVTKGKIPFTALLSDDKKSYLKR